MDWQIETPRINKKASYVKVAFPLNIEDPNESNDPDKGLLRIKRFDKIYQDGIVLPKSRISIAPVIPTEIRGKGMHSVTIEIVVNENGGIKDVTVIENTHEKAAQNTLKAFKQWRFQPGYKDKKPVQMKLRYTINFYPNSSISWKDYELVCVDC